MSGRPFGSMCLSVCLLARTANVTEVAATTGYSTSLTCRLSADPHARNIGAARDMAREIGAQRLVNLALPRLTNVRVDRPSATKTA